MRYFLVFVTALLAACGPSGAQADPTSSPKANIEPQVFVADWIIDKPKSHIRFTASQSGEDFSGVFEDFTAVIKFDPADLKQAKVKVGIVLGSADSGDSERDQALPSKDWFSIKKFPEAIFETKSFSPLGADQYEAQAVLTIKGIAKKITLPFTLSIKDGIANMSGKITLNRRDFNVGEGMWKSEDWVGHSVIVDVNLTATKNTP